MFNDKVETTKTGRSMLSTPRWSNSTTASILTPFAEGLLREQYLHAHNYSYVEVSKNRRYMKCNKPVTLDNTFLPMFKSTRVLELDQNTNLSTCSCAYYSRLGLPCRYQILLMGKYEGYQTSFRWWRINGIKFNDASYDNISSIIKDLQMENPLLQHSFI